MLVSAERRVELAGPPGTPLDGWQVEGGNGFNGATGPVIPLSGSIPASGLFVLADRTGGGSVFVPNADLVANFDFQNGPDSIVLRDETGIVDAVGYGRRLFYSHKPTAELWRRTKETGGP